MRASPYPIKYQFHNPMPIPIASPRSLPNKSYHSPREQFFPSPRPRQNKVNPSQKNRLFNKKLEKIQRQMQQEMREYKARFHRPATHIAYKEQNLTQRNKSWSANTVGSPSATISRIRTQGSEDSIGSYPLQLKRQFSETTTKQLSGKKVVYIPVEKQLKNYPQAKSFKNAIEARDVSIVPLAKKGVVVRYDAEFKTMKHDLIYDYAKRECRSPIGYREGIQVRRLSNLVENPERLLDHYIQSGKIDLFKGEKEVSISVEALKRAQSSLNGRNLFKYRKQLSPRQRSQSPRSTLEEVPEENPEHPISQFRNKQQIMLNRNHQINMVKAEKTLKQFAEKRKEFSLSFESRQKRQRVFNPS